MPKQKATVIKLSEATEQQVQEMVQDGHTTVEETETDQENRGTGRKKKDGNEFSYADPAEQLGRLIINQNYPHLKHKRILYIFQSETSKQDGELIAMQVKTLAGLNAWLATCFDGVEGVPGEADACFVILISQKFWDGYTPKQRELYLDHALAQCGVSETTGSIKRKKYEIQTNTELLHRHGMWNEKLKGAGQVLKQHILQPELDVAS